MDYRQVRKQMQRGNFLPLYLFSGAESYLQEKLLEFLLQQLEEKSGQAYHLERVDGRQVELPDLLQGLQQGTIFSQGRVIWVSSAPYFSATRGKAEEKGAAGKGAKAGAAENKHVEADLAALAENQDRDLIVVFSTDKVDRRKKMVKALEKAGVLVEFAPPRGPALLKWVRGALEQEGKVIDESALQLLVERVGEEMQLLRSELDKLILYLGAEQRVTEEIVRRLVSESRQGNIFKLVGAIGQKNVSEAFHHLSRMRQQNEHPLVILTMIARHFRLLYQTLHLEKEGIPRRRIAPELKVPFFAAEELLAQVELYTETSLAKTLVRLKELDFEIKTGRRDAGDALEHLVLQLTMTKTKASLQ